MHLPNFKDVKWMAHTITCITVHTHFNMSLENFPHTNFHSHRLHKLWTLYFATTATAMQQDAYMIFTEIRNCYGSAHSPFSSTALRLPFIFCVHFSCRLIRLLHFCSCLHLIYVVSVCESQVRLSFSFWSSMSLIMKSDESKSKFLHQFQ